ncbi:cytochrome b [Ferrimonas sp. SCSIO 43195]|nr:cytochrome b [Ferrimonas sp. SCSIO 43195]
MGLHWVMALMLIALVAIGNYMVSLESGDPNRLPLMGLHKSLGVVFMQLAIARVIWHRISRPPKLPQVLAAWERRLSQTITLALYFFMLAIPFSGYLMTNYAGFPVIVFGLVKLPLLVDKDPALVEVAKQAHLILVSGLMGALLAHIAGAIKHRVFDAPEADVLPRMLPVKPRS